MSAAHRIFVGHIYDEAQMLALGFALAKILTTGDLLVLTGALGAGKTTLTRGLGNALGLQSRVSSPTFVIARTHKRTNEQLPPLVHVDAYRLGSAAELDDLDIDFENCITVVEWGKGFTEGISENWLSVQIERDHSGESEIRGVLIEGFGERWQNQAEITLGGN